MSKRVRSEIRTAGVASALLTAGLAMPADAHLSIIRQGYECAGVNESGDQLGYAVAAGDFNGDGYDDLAMGAVHEAIGAEPYAGAVIVSWGSKHGITHVGSTAYWADHMTATAERFANVGHALAAGDFNGDSIDDLAIGAPGANGAVSSSGLVFVMRGSPSGLQAWGILDQADLGVGASSGDQFGYSLAAGDINGDTYADLAIGAPGMNGAAGMAFYALGSFIGPFSGQRINKALMGFGASLSNDRFGFSVAIGNVIGSSYGDVIIGAPYEDTSVGFQDVGRVFAVAGTSGGVDVNTAVQHYTPGSFENGERFGYAVAAGNVFNQAYEAVAAGSPDRTVNGFADAGRVSVIPGGATDLDTGNTVFVTQDMTGWTIEGSERFGNAVAVGSFWDDDGYDDLAVGYPGESYSIVSGAGGVSILWSGPAGPTGAYGWYGFSQQNLNEFLEPVDQLGFSLAFGEFDAGNRGNLAVGAPGEDSYAGMVHVIAPWRQVYGLTCERSVAYDCEHDLVFSQKPFDQVKIASTTKIMTILIAAERSQLPTSDPRYVSLSTPYTVPAWVADNIPGSQVPLITSETMSLQDLMYACLMRSGNDAAFAIADLLHGQGGPYSSLPLFVQEMNDRAAALGMNGSHFHNPAGLDNEPVGPEMGEHYSTPYDMGLLSRAAMQNPLVADIAGSISRVLTRRIFGNTFQWTCNNIFGGVLMNGTEVLNGIKGGATPGAQTTGCFSAENPLSGGIAISGTYTTPLNNGGNYAFDGARLVQLGLAECGYLWSIPDGWIAKFPFRLANLSAAFGERGGGGGQFAPGNTGDIGIGFALTDSDGTDARMEVCINHLGEYVAEGGAGFQLGATQVSKHGDIKITNLGEETASFEVQLPYDELALELRPNESQIIPAYEFPVTTEFQWTILGEAGLYVGVEQPVYVEIVVPGETPIGPVVDLVLFRPEETQTDGLSVLTEGLSSSTSRILLSETDGRSSVALPDPGAALDATPGPLTLGAPFPNPFRTHAEIGFDAHVGGALEMSVYDVRGRRVRRFPVRAVTPGRWAMAWDGADDSGRAVAEGAYFVRFALDGAPAGSRKVIRIR